MKLIQLSGYKSTEFVNSSRLAEKSAYNLWQIPFQLEKSKISVHVMDLLFPSWPWLQER